MMGDFNCHHKVWYAELAMDTGIYNIRNKKGQSEALVAYIEHHSYSLQYTPVVFTHFPRNTNGASIIDLIVIKGPASTMATMWSWDPSLSGTSNHNMTGLALSVGKLRFTPHRRHRLTDWDKFEAKIRELVLPAT